ncbi:MAG: prepilin-type N-terminal cleavage/methylation domain-containing protein [Candidatus Pacebacteria bacterium]|nr:prepilin-type N-terminal cleavage/methylation domain-containing protein [Candidatus Paceibacterota bacterium]
MEQKSFTLIEILVVIVIVGIISAFIIVSMSGVSDKARIAKSQVFSNSLKNSLLMNLVSEWKFDGNADDSWGTNNGTLIGPTHLPVLKTGSDCISGSCYDFDGSEDYINIGSGPSLVITDAISIEFWAYKEGTSSNGYCSEVVSRRNCYDVCCEDLYTTFPGVTGTPLIADNSIPSYNKWYYLVYTYDSNDKIGRAYRDSTLINTKDVAASYPTATSYKLGTSCGGLSISNPSYRWNGLLDEIRLYGVAIPTSQIRQNYYSGLSRLLLNNNLGFNEYQERISSLAKN